MKTTDERLRALESGLDRVLELLTEVTGRNALNQNGLSFEFNIGLREAVRKLSADIKTERET